MSLRSVLVLMLALACGGSAAVGVKALTAKPAGPGPETISVVVAAADIPRGASLSPEILKVRDFPKDLATPGMMSRVEEAGDRVALVPFVKDELILGNKLADRRSGRGWAAMIPKGMRAFSILTPSLASNISGFIMPGNKVDVLLTITNSGSDDGSGGASTTTLLQNVEVWAVGQRIEAQTDGKVDTREMQSVTLLVTPDQAATLDLGQNKGTLHLALRNPEDTAAADTKPATLSGIRFRQEPPWDERAKGLLAAAAKALAATRRPDPPPPPPVVAAAPQPVETPAARIRTLRGADEGAVLVQSPAAPSGR